MSVYGFVNIARWSDMLCWAVCYAYPSAKPNKKPLHSFNLRVCGEALWVKNGQLTKHVMPMGKLGGVGAEAVSYISPTQIIKFSAIALPW